VAASSRSSSDTASASAAAAGAHPPSAGEDAADATPEDSAAAAAGEPLGVQFDVALLVLHGFAPDLRPGLQLGAAALLGAFSLHVGGRVALPQTVDSPDGSARFGLYAALIELCGSARLAPGPVAWYGCGVVEPGVFTAAGADTRNPQDHSRAWLALGAGTGFSFGLGAGLGLRAGAELLIPTRRDRALLADVLVHEVTAACLRLQLGIEARPW
jgi:hypothetical protein